MVRADTYIDPVNSRFSPVWLVLIGIFSVQFGAGIAKTLFDEVDPTVIVWLRLVTSAVVLMLAARPALRNRSAHDWLVVAGFGASLGVMNWAIYQSFARVPLGIAVTIEFIGPLTLTGVLFALLAGAAWATYILLSAQTGRRWPGLDGLALASVVATLLLTPFAVPAGGGDLVDTRVLALGAAVGLLSSVIPYSCELVALRSLLPAVFSILMSLEPAAAALAGIVVLGEFLTAVQWLAMVCVVVASVGATRSGAGFAEPVPD